MKVIDHNVKHSFDENRNSHISSPFTGIANDNKKPVNKCISRVSKQLLTLFLNSIIVHLDKQG